MSEKLPQPNPEEAVEKQYFIPVSGQGAAIGSVNYRKQKIHVSRRVEGPDMMVTHVEVSYETTDADGDPAVVTKWISDHHLTESGQRDLAEKYINSIDKNSSQER